MKSLFCIVAIGLSLAGCGYNPDTAVYDTLANPDGFPQPALNLINGIEKNQLATYNAITDAFSELYSTRPDLLDNTGWEKIVSRLGIKFRMRADSLAALGITHYRHAGELYTLAAFARPQDNQVQERRDLFDAWEKAVRDSVIDTGRFADANNPGISERLAVLKYFLMGDSVRRRFGQEYLLQQVLDLDSVEAALKPSSTHPLKAVDRCFLAVIGLKKYSGNDQIVTFAEPEVDLIAAQIKRESGHWYSAELYFIPHEKLSDDYSVAFRVSERDSAGGVSPTPVTLDFRIQPAASTWLPGEIYGTYRRFLCDGSPVRIEVGLYAHRGDRIEFIPVRETGKPLYQLPPSAMASQ
ncbi:hypothetical protein C3F09_08620 [candidate division GN15 bacterium]|uniref:Uncharacterized protein n=1 Tax=candidate division GN15 bacterium TaxID=2072418 RepID=A0A855WYV4_9BACT|nr:MAG: hypothetical protein C3F09_08620 [candidate division GN15 bacterium]